MQNRPVMVAILTEEKMVTIPALESVDISRDISFSWRVSRAGSTRSPLTRLIFATMGSARSTLPLVSSSRGDSGTNLGKYNSCHFFHYAA